MWNIALGILAGFILVVLFLIAVGIILTMMTASLLVTNEPIGKPVSLEDDSLSQIGDK